MINNHDAISTNNSYLDIHFNAINYSNKPDEARTN